MKTDNHVILPDGRKLAYAEFGKSDGCPVLYFHGAPSCRLEPLLIGDESLSRLGLRVIAPDRPGMGRSDFQPNRGFSDWPKDVVALAQALGLERFAVLGISGGGPYVAACAAKIPERLSAAVIVAGAWRVDWPEAKDNQPLPNRLVWFVAKHSPLLLRLMLKAMAASIGGEREKQLAQLKKGFPPADYLVLEQSNRLEAFGQMVHECYHRGTKGPAWDMQLYVREFDFQFDEIHMPLKLFHGEQDVNVPIALVRRVVAELPSAQLVTYENEAHLSTLCNQLDDIAEALVKTGD
jgi:pimeloyl-ACP methyl ester carboxylesterase